MVREKIPETATIVDLPLREPDCASLLRAARANPARYQVSPWEVEPIYLRGSSAEEKRKRET
jgi:hypothetical protein